MEVERDEAFENFKSITGTKDNLIVQQYLEACCFDLAKAVDLFFSREHKDEVPKKGGRPKRNGQSTSREQDVYMLSEDDEDDVDVQEVVQPVTRSMRNGQKKSEVKATNGKEKETKMDDDVVRAPIPSVRATLVPHSFDEQYGIRNSRAQQPFSAFENPPDFKALAAAQEDALRGRAGPSSSTRSLRSLFQPPTDLTFQGDFEAVKAEATADGKWLLVNVQDQKEFACQTLNRDVWANSAVKELVRANFVFWQVWTEQADGHRMKTYYDLRDLPSVFILDPRTGERVATIPTSKQDTITICDALTQFIDEFPDFATRDRTLTEMPSLISEAAAMPDLPESSGEASIGESRKRKGSSDDDHESGKKSRLDIKGLSIVDRDEWKTEIVPGDPVRVSLKFPDGQRQNIEMTSNTKLSTLFKFIAGAGLSPREHMFVLSFPKRCYEESRGGETLKELGFSRQELVHVEMK